jgi:hypothetical protein
LRPIDSIAPQLAVGGCTPRPRKDSPASNSTIRPNSSVATTASGATMLGSTCSASTRAIDAPIERASRT